VVGVTYLGRKEERGYVLGSCGSLREAMKESGYKRGFDVFYFRGDVKRLILSIGCKKVHDLVSIVESYHHEESSRSLK